jgi:hypothetical protein
MRYLFLLLSFLAFTNVIKAQDTIFMKTGAIIPAIILEKGEVEIKYKKIAQPESAGIYTVFNSDVASIHFKNGTVANYTKSNQNSINNESNQSTHWDPSAPVMKFNIGVSGNYFMRNESDNLKLFWRNMNGGNPNLEIAGNPRYFCLNLSMCSPIGGTKRNWLGATLQLAFTPSDAISASNTYNGFSNEIKLNAFYYNIILYYGHTINHKKTLIIIFEPAVDIAMMSGSIKMQDISYKEFAISGNSHFALGFDWIISKRILANLRAGERFMNIKEEHEDKTMSSGYGSFYVNYPANKDLVKVSWSGSYVSLGLSYSLYGKMRPGRRK